MNNKGFTNITVIYSFVLLIILSLLLILTTLKAEHESNIEYINDINESLDLCLKQKRC